MGKKKSKASRATQSKKAGLCVTDEALFVIPARLTRPFFTQLYAACEEKIFQHFKETIRPVVRAVTSVDAQFDAGEVTRILEREFRMNPGRIKFLIVVPTDSKELSVGVAQVSSDHSVPVIALTLPFHQWPEKFEDESGNPTGKSERKLPPPPPPVILCKSDHGTRELARVAALELRKRAIDRPIRVWVIPGARRIDSLWRIKGFMRGLRDQGVRLAGKPNWLASANWLRRDAYDVVRVAIIEHAELVKTGNEPTVPVDILFAANDEMALGARDAIRESNRSKETRKIAGNCLIFGFDAIAEARSLIKKNNGDIWLKGTVEQQLPLMADRLVAIMKSILNRNGNPSNGEVPPIAIVHSETVQELAAIDAYPDRVPPITDEHFLPAAVAAKELKVDEGTLEKYRERNSDCPIKDDIGYLGIDQYDGIYRIDSDGEVFYWRGSIASRIYAAKRKRKRSSKNA